MPYIKINADNTVDVGGDIATTEMLNDGWILYNGVIPTGSKLTWDAVNSVIVSDIAYDKESKLLYIEKCFRDSINGLTTGYSKEEIDTWDIQYNEAKRWEADNTVATPFLDNLATNRGITRDVVIQRVLSKASTFQYAVSVYLGYKQRLEDMVTAATTMDDLDLIVWEDPLDPNVVEVDPFSDTKMV